MEQRMMRKNSTINKLIYKNNVVLRDSEYCYRANENRVNINAWVTEGDCNNVGDQLSIDIVKWVCKIYGIDYEKEVRKTKHLYAIGSILLGYQDATIWGSGFGYDRTNSKLWKYNAYLHRHYHKTDIRAVRGPRTRAIFEKMGIKCPEIYGDPAVLTPLLYNEKPSPKREYILIPHYSKFDKYSSDNNVLCTFQDDINNFIKELLKAKLVISSSLHGIILAEAYGIPAVLLSDTPTKDITKYEDWYLSTKRIKIPIVNSIDEALKYEVEPLDMEIVKNMQDRLLEVFPKDLWE